MKTIGRFLINAREGNGLSVDELSELTKIKSSFITNLEQEDWEKLPSYTVIYGFVKNISSSLKVSEREAVALFRRDYPPLKKTMIQATPKLDIREPVTFGPRALFLLVIVLSFLGLSIYIYAQYRSFLASPVLMVDSPQNEQRIVDHQIEVTGKTDPQAVVRVNNQSALVENDGTFKTLLLISESTTKIEIKATSRSGRESVVERTIIPDFN